MAGATRPERLARLRELMPRAIFLLPGVGAQGGSAAELGPAFEPHPAAGLVAASRSIVNAHPERGGDRGRCSAGCRGGSSSPDVELGPRYLPTMRADSGRCLQNQTAAQLACSRPSRWSWSRSRSCSCSPARARTPTTATARSDTTERTSTERTTARKPPPRRAATYTVKPGDTLGAIAEKTGLDVETLQTLNPELDPQALVSGQKIKLRE